MASEELEHVATLRRERRRAFHAERSATPPRTGSYGDAEAELRLAELLEVRARQSDSNAPAPFLRLASETRQSAAELQRDPFELGATSSAEIPDDPVALSELLVDRYLELAERLRSEDAVARAQALAARAINRLAWLRSGLPELTRRSNGEACAAEGG